MTVKCNSQAGGPASASTQGELNPRERILVVEHDADVRQLNTKVLTYSGYRVDVPYHQIHLLWSVF
jgi:hypothetical protein